MERVKSATILVSRQHLRPSLKDEWVRKLLLAVKHVKDQGWILNSSVGSPNWEIITAAATIIAVPLKLFLPVSNTGDFENAKLTNSHNFDLANRSVEFEAVLPKGRIPNREEHWQQRDRAVLESSNILIPVSVRPNGTMSELLYSAKKSDKQVTDEFEAEYDGSSTKLSYTIGRSSLSDGIKKIGNHFVFHWTRASNGPWPNERKIDFYGDVLKSTEFPRTAFRTLKRILDEKLIIASAKNMPGKTPAVSFTGLAPIDIIKLMKWRARYSQMTFEPFGIGIEKDTALSMGIGKVQYYDIKSRKNNLSHPSWLRQSMGKITDWRNENEFRYKGNFDLNNIPTDKLIAVCFHKDEATKLENETGIKTVSFCD